MSRTRKERSWFKRRRSVRDLQALTFIGEGYEVAQYQLQAAVFAGLSPTVASRFVRRALQTGAIVVERLGGIGINRLRLTPAGLDALAASGQSVERVFTPRRGVAAKDLQHTLRINDLRVVLAASQRPPTELLPAWALQRSLILDAVPDLLAIWHQTNGSKVVLACEIDLGTESLTASFLPKLRRLARSIQESGAARGEVLVLTQGRRRFERLLNAASELTCLMVAELPEGTGSRGLAALRDRLQV